MQASLMQAREFHAAGIVTDEATDENFVTVTGPILRIEPTKIYNTSKKSSEKS